MSEANSLDLLSAGSIGSEVGNTIPPPSVRPSRGKRWCFTLFDYNLEDFFKLRDILSWNSLVDELIMQEEQAGSTGRPHVQGHVVFKRPVRPYGAQTACHDVFILKPAHWEKMKNLLASREYCQKDDTRAEGGERFV